MSKPVATVDMVRVLRETFVARAEYHPEIGSTNDRAAQCAALGARELPLLIVAEQQTAGRGRGVNRWWTGRDALAMSLLIDPRTAAADQDRSPLVALAAAVAVVEAIIPLLPQRRVGLHWPNDVLSDGRKLAGILVEVLPDRRHVIGIGLNTNNTLAEAPADLQTTAATIRDLSGAPCDQTEVLICLLKRLELAFRRLRETPDSIAAEADTLCLQRGAMLELRQGDRAIVGRCQGIAADGAIRLETPSGVQQFYSGSLR